jgi:hypothetical protein
MKFKLFVLAIATLAMTSCGGGDSSAPKPIIVKPAQTEIKGDLKGCFEVVDKEFKVYKDYSAYVVQVELKRTDVELPYDRKDVTIFPEAKDSEKSNIAGFGIEVLDSLGTVIAKNEANATPYSWDEMKAVLQLLPGETATINFHIYDSLHSATQYRVTSLVEQNTKQEGDIVDRALDKLDKEISEEIEDDVEDGIEDVKKATKAVKDVLEVEKEILDLL